MVPGTATCQGHFRGKHGEAKEQMAREVQVWEKHAGALNIGGAWEYSRVTVSGEDNGSGIGEQCSEWKPPKEGGR